MAVRLSPIQREAVRRDLASGGWNWWTGELAASFAEARSDLDPILGMLAYHEAILKYRDWLVANYRTVRAQARAA